MSADRLEFHWSPIWLLAAMVVSSLEIVVTRGRPRLTKPLRATVSEFESAKSNYRQRLAVLKIGTVSSQDVDSAILVLGNLGDVLDGDIKIVLSAKRSMDTAINENNKVFSLAKCMRHSSNSQAANPNSPALSQGRHTGAIPKEYHDATRVYFVPASVGSAGKVSHSPISCRLAAENLRIRIYVDQRLPANERLAELVQAVNDSSASHLGDTVHEMVGAVADLDRDGHLAVVITSEIAHLGGGRTPIDGLTRPADFVSGLDRPLSNNSDVIFVNSRLEPGDQMRAVLAHEWCHAAVFSRRRDGALGEAGHATEEDWMNEAIAHLVELRASGSASNVSHRVRGFLSQPGNSPLIVRDYYQPKFWRHDGCRGAAFLFLEWCMNQTDDALLSRLIGSQTIGLESLEAATSRTFDDLFRGWTTSLAQRLVDDREGSLAKSVTGSINDPPACLDWHLDTNSNADQTVTVRLQGTSASFVRIHCGADTNWELSAECDGIGPVQTTLIPVKRATSSHR